MNTHFETLEDAQIRKVNFQRGKTHGENRVAGIPREDRLEIAKNSAAQYVLALEAGSNIPYSFAQGDWYGVDYHGHTLSMVIDMIKGETE